MANNFKFLSNQIRDRIRLKLYGDFDGSSASELINVLKNYTNGSYQIFIDTNNLNTIHPFGMDVFKKNLSVLDRGPTSSFVQLRSLYTKFARGALYCEYHKISLIADSLNIATF